jgi:hypothetical protein
MTVYISNFTHYKEVLSRVQTVKHMLWVGTADIKDLYVDAYSGDSRSPIPMISVHSVGDFLFRRQS